VVIDGSFPGVGFPDSVRKELTRDVSAMLAH
jgi:hypothetical protein